MKPTMALKPLVFALAALMAVAAQASPAEKWKPTPVPSGTVAAVVTDTQVSKDNKFDDTKTLNNAGANGSLNSSKGNLGANIAGAPATNKTLLLPSPVALVKTRPPFSPLQTSIKKAKTTSSLTKARRTTLRWSTRPTTAPVTWA